MPNRQRNLGINIRVTPAEKKKIGRNAKKCKLTVSEYLRQLAMNKEPKELPSDEIMKSIMRIQKVVLFLEKTADASSNETNRKNYTNAANYLRNIQKETIHLMTHSKAESEVNSDGSN